MNSRIEWLLGLALAQLVLIGLVVFSGALTEDDNTGFSVLEENQIEALVVSDQDSAIRIERGDAQWSVEGYLGDADKISGVVEKVD